MQSAASTLCKAEKTTSSRFIVSEESVKSNLAKIETIQIFLILKGRKAVRQLLGTGSYYSKFLQKDARRAFILQTLVLQDTEFNGGLISKELLRI